MVVHTPCNRPMLGLLLAQVVLINLYSSWEPYLYYFQTPYLTEKRQQWSKFSSYYAQSLEISSKYWLTDSHRRIIGLIETDLGVRGPGGSEKAREAHRGEGTERMKVLNSSRGLRIR
uniref:Uncharacterized protein n=2 Tax=Opuntia streptacantha TaxID=393608 RepID=A0A7C8YKX2_OPUST